MMLVISVGLLAINVTEIVNDTKILDGFINVFNGIVTPIVPDHVLDTLISDGVKYERIISAIKLIADYMQLMEGLDATSTVELTDDCKIKIGTIVSKDGVTIDFAKLMGMYSRINELFNPTSQS
jgi:hypothetical protein